MNKIYIVSIILIAGCTAVVVPRNNREPTKILVEQGRDNLCGIYRPLPRPSIPSLEEYTDTIENINTDSDVAVESLLRYIALTQKMQTTYDEKSDRHYQEYIKKCSAD